MGEFRLSMPAGLAATVERQREFQRQADQFRFDLPPRPEYRRFWQIGKPLGLHRGTEYPYGGETSYISRAYANPVNGRIDTVTYQFTYRAVAMVNGAEMAGMLSCRVPGESPMVAVERYFDARCRLIAPDDIYWEWDTGHPTGGRHAVFAWEGTNVEIVERRQW